MLSNEQNTLKFKYLSVGIRKVTYKMPFLSKVRKDNYSSACERCEEAWCRRWYNHWQRTSSSNPVASKWSLGNHNTATLMYQSKYVILEEHTTSEESCRQGFWSIMTHFRSWLFFLDSTKEVWVSLLCHVPEKPRVTLPPPLLWTETSRSPKKQQFVGSCFRQ